MTFPHPNAADTPGAAGSSSEPRGALLLGPADIRELADELDINPTKKLGQNFVHDPNTVRKIVNAAELRRDDHVIEVGPGLGSLTLALLDSVDSVTAIEIDPRLAAKLPETIAARGPEREGLDFRVLLQDALRISQQDWVSAGRPQPTALVANLPYNASVPVLLHLLHEFPTIKRVLVMVQLEVADRLAAHPGSKIYGVPSVKARFYGDVSRAATIGKNVFWPAPKIDSGLVRIDRWEPGTAPWDQEVGEASANDQLRATVFSLADAAFLQRRKTLRAALSSWFGSGVKAEQALTAAGIDPKERGEKLSTTHFVDLARVALASKEGLE